MFLERIGLGFDVPFAQVALMFGLLLVLLIVLWVMSFRSLAGLGNFRRLFALGFRTLVLILIVMCLAEVQFRKTSEKVTVIYLLDQSESIPLEKRQAMLQYVIEEVSEHRRADRNDRAGAIVFGRNANIEIPPFDDDIQVLGSVDSYVGLNTDATNLEAALKLAQASFTEDTAKRIVIVTDGNENLGDARTIAATLVDDGIGIDVAPIRLTARSEVAVEKVTLPPDIRRGQPVEARVIVNNYAEHNIAGKLRVTRRSSVAAEFLGEIDVDLKPGKSPYKFTQEIEQPDIYTYEANFIPNNPEDDLMVQNNRATAFTHVRGQGRVLFIEDFQHVGDFDFLIDRLKANNIEVTIMPNNELFSNFAQLQPYDSIILGNVPRGSGDATDSDSFESFSDKQIEMLVRNTEQTGCGLVMLGGPDSFGAGAWANTKLEEAMPVDFQIKDSKVRAVGALVLMMHASELAEGNYWQKEVASVSIKALGPMDYCGLLHWDFGAATNTKWLWGEPKGLIQVRNRRNMMLARLGRMAPGDMPEFEPAMKKALVSFNGVKASVKHMIVISDGDPAPPDQATVRRFRNAGIQVSTVAVGTHGRAGHKTLEDLAIATKGRYYVVKNPKALPKIYQSEVRRVARPLIHEPDPPVAPQIIGSHEIVQGIDSLPPISGFVLTSIKDNPLVETIALSPQPADERHATIMAAWTYGLGRTAVLTTDAGKRWATSWTDWENYEKLFTQMVRWSMRPVDDTGKFTVATDVRDGKVRVIVTALDKEDEFLNFLNMSSTSLDPDLNSGEVAIRQVAPGRYVSEFDAPKDGNYFITINPGAGHSPLLTGVNVPYSSEFRERETNMALLDALAQLQPKNGEPGVIINGQLEEEGLQDLLKFDTFRSGLPPAISSQDIWPLALLLCASVFFADVFVRRVTISWEWVGPFLLWLRVKVFGAEETEQHEERLDRLRSRKAAIAGEIDERRAATRFEPVMPDEGGPAPDLDDVLQDASAGQPTERPQQQPTSRLSPDAQEEESYTSRLLKAKKKAWNERKDGS